MSIDVDGRSSPVTLRAVAYPSMTASRVTIFQDVQLITVTPQIQLERGLVSSDGALIDDVTEQFSRQTGLQRGDVILQINRSRIRTADDAKEYFDGLQGSGRIVVYLERNGSYGTRTLYWRGS